jgi:excisionase family DNA binding protein
MASATKLVKELSPAPPAHLLTVEEVAQFTGLSVDTLAQWRSQRRGIPFVKLSRNVVRYRQADLDAFLNGCTVPVEQDSYRGRRQL